MSVPAELHYTEEHEWVSIAGDTATVGITDYAAQQLGDVVYVSLPAVGAAVTSGEPCGEVESTKSVSDLYSPWTARSSRRTRNLTTTPAWSTRSHTERAGCSGSGSRPVPAARRRCRPGCSPPPSTRS